MRIFEVTESAGSPEEVVRKVRRAILLSRENTPEIGNSPQQPTTPTTGQSPQIVPGTTDQSPQIVPGQLQQPIDPNAPEVTRQTSGNVPPRPTGSGRNVRGSQVSWDRRYGATHNPDGTPKNESIG